MTTFRFHASRIGQWFSSLSFVHWCILNGICFGWLFVCWQVIFQYPLMTQETQLKQQLATEKHTHRTLESLHQQAAQLQQKYSSIEQTLQNLSEYTLPTGSLFDKTVAILSQNGLSCKNVAPFIYQEEAENNIVQHGVKIEASGPYQAIYECIHAFWLNKKFFLKCLSIEKKDQSDLTVQITFLTCSKNEKAP